MSLGELDSMPACECYDWVRYHWPCKHTLAIFQQGVKTRDDLFPAYRDSPFFPLDVDLFDNMRLVMCAIIITTVYALTCECQGRE